MAYTGYQGYGSRAEAEKRRAIAEALKSNFLARAPQNIGEGLTAIGQALAIRGQTKKASKIEKALAGHSAQAREALKGAMFGGGGARQVQPQQFPTAPMPSQAPAPQPSQMGGGIAQGLAETAQAIGMDPVDLATIVSYETGGTFDPAQPGPTTKWGQHKGLIQFGEPQAERYGVDWNDPAGSQLGPEGAIARYFRENGWQPGMGLEDAYSIVNAGAPGRYNASDEAAGGAPGTVRDKVAGMAPHREKAAALLGNVPTGGMSAAANAGPSVEVAQAGGFDPDTMSLLFDMSMDPNLDPQTREMAGQYLQTMTAQQMQATAPITPYQQRQLGQGDRGLDLEAQGQQFDQRMAEVKQRWEEFKFQNPQLPTEAQMALFAQENPDAMEALAEFEQSKRPQTNINTGTIPAGYEQFTTPEGAIQMRPIPGGPADAKTEEAQRQRAGQQELKSRYGNIVLEDLGRVRERVEASPLTTTGVGGLALKQIPGTQAYDTSQLLDTIRANVGFDRLQQMREASPTGGALGQVSELENKLLQATLGNLEQSQSEEQFLHNLNRMEEVYLDIIHGPGNRPGSGEGQGDDIDALLEKYR